MKATTGNRLVTGIFFGGVLMWLAGVMSAQAQYNYKTLDVPGAVDTYACGISGNTIVGYDDTAGSYQGFLYDGNSYTTLNVPGALNTVALGISGNNAVGYYNNNVSSQGFLYNGSTYTTLVVPGESVTVATGISGNNIVGWCSDNSDHSFFYNGSSYTILDVPGALGTYAEGIYGSTVVGYYVTTNGGAPSGAVLPGLVVEPPQYYHGFIYNGGSYSTWDIPGATDTYPSGIFGNEIVGNYDDASGNDAFWYDGSSDHILDVPGSFRTDPNGISGDEIVGDYDVINGVLHQEHGFVVTVPEPSAWAVLAVGGMALLVVRQWRKRKES